MSIPSTVVGYGSKDTYLHKFVFAVRFHHPLSDSVTYVCYDNNQTYPQTDSLTSTDNDVFGMGVGENSMIALVDTTNGTAGCGGTPWFPASPNANTATMNLMKGLTNYVKQHGDVLEDAGGGTIYFNMQMKTVASCQTSSSMGFDLNFKYSYTSTIPAPSLFFNDAVGSGTEAVPVWLEITPDTHGIKHCRAGLGVGDGKVANVPETGQEKTQDAWVTT